MNEEGIILKNLPDGLLNDNQIEIKQKILKTDIDKIIENQGTTPKAKNVNSISISSIPETPLKQDIEHPAQPITYSIHRH